MLLFMLLLYMCFDESVKNVLLSLSSEMMEDVYPPPRRRSPPPRRNMDPDFGESCAFFVESGYLI
jgi:hypothetical protein